MIDFETNGVSRPIEPGSIEELRREIDSAVPTGHGICVIRLDGREIGEVLLDEFSVSSIRRVQIETRELQALAAESTHDTAEWIERIRGVLDKAAADFRMGREAEGAARLVDVVDALQVLMPLLQGIHDHLSAERRQGSFEQAWTDAERALNAAVTALVDDFEKGDPVHLADLTGHVLPRGLGAFRELLLTPSS